jgi:uncharacterized metal-binding protein YceD (DUF177 family)
MAADRIDIDVSKAWPQPLGLAEAARGPVRRKLSADETSRARIAKVLGLDSLAALDADITVSSWLDGVQIHGTWRARVGQTCGVSLEPFETDLDGELQIRAVPEGSQALTQADEDHEVELDPEADDPPDVLTSDQIDLGAYVVEDLSLAVDPFPRKPGVDFEPPETTAEISPFAVLAKLKGGLPDA